MAALNSKLIQRITNTNAADVVHSSVYAKAQQASSGVPQHSSMAFSERNRIDQNRTLVKGYSDSSVAKSGNKRPMANSTTTQNSADTIARQSISQATQQQRANYSAYGDGGSFYPGYQSSNNQSATQGAPINRGYGRTPASEGGTRFGAASTGVTGAGASTTTAEQRQARADRFSATRSKPGASSGSARSAAPRPAIRPSFGRH